AAVVERALQPLPLVRRAAGEERLEPAQDEGGAALVGEGRDLLRRGAEASLALVRQVSAGGHGGQPLTDVALDRPGPRGELLRGGGLPVGEGLEEAQPLSQQRER